MTMESKFKLQESKDITYQELTFQRDEITKIGEAKLRFRGRNVGKGTLIGAGTGAGVGLLGAVSASNDALAGAAVPLFAIMVGELARLLGYFLKRLTKREG